MFLKKRLQISKNTKRNEDYIKAILDSFEELGIDTSSASIDFEVVEFSDEKLAKLVYIG